MKRIISLLVVLAMLMAMAPVVFAAPTSGSGVIGDPYVYSSVDALVSDWTGKTIPAGETVYLSAPIGGETITVTSDTTAAALQNAMGANIAFDGESFDFSQYYSAGDVVNFSIWNQNPRGAAVVTLTASSNSGSNPGGGTTTPDGSSNAPFIVDTLPADLWIGFVSYSGNDYYYQYIAEQDGTIVATINEEETYCDIIVNDVYAGSTSATVTAGDTVVFNIYSSYVNDRSVSVAYGTSGGSTITGTGVMGDPYVYSSVDALVSDWTGKTIPAGETVYLSAPIGGETITVTSDTTAAALQNAMGANIAFDGEPFDFSQYYSAGDVVNFSIWNQNPRGEAIVTLTASSNSGSNPGGGTTTPDGSSNAPFIVDTLPADLWIGYGSYGGNDFYYQYIAEQDGTIVATINEEETYCDIIVNDVYAGSTSATVTAGDTVVFNIYSGFANDRSVSVAYGTPGSNPGGGTTTPDGSSNAPFIVDTLPADLWIGYGSYGGNDFYYQYTAEQDGTIEITANEEEIYCDIIVNGVYVSSTSATVAAGDVVVFNVYSGFTNDRSVTVAYGSGAGGAGGETTPVHSGTESVAADQTVEIPFTPDADGVLTIDISGDPGYRLEVQNTATLDTIGLREESSQDQTLTFDLVAGVEYKILINGFSTATWDVAAATITYEASFTSGTGGAMEDLDESAVELVVGEQNVELLPNAITTLYNFYAPEAGVYTVTIPNDAIAELYSVGWTSYQLCEGNTLVFTATADEQGFLIGLTSEADSMNVKIEKTGTYTPPAETTYLNYEATVEFDEEFVMPEGDVTSVDITAAQTVVLGTDGYYHLGTADGPILYVNLNSDGFTLATLMDAGAPITMRGEKFEGEDGKLYCYDYMNLIAFGDYYDYSYDCDYYPLNADLMAFFQDYGTAQGWYDAEFSGFEAIKAGEFEEESAWMVALVYFEAETPEGDTGNQGNTGNNAQTGDFGVIAAAVALGVSAICGTAVIAKKKEN